MSPIIEAQGLSKTYPGGIKAVDDISFAVEEGEIFGFLGPNGAGKSTTIAMLTTLIKPTAGTARVAGMDVRSHAYQVRLAIGYVSQDLAVDDNLTGYENLRLQAGFYHIPRPEAERRIREVLEMVELTERAGELVERYSGGMRKRLDIACGLIHYPRILFLDEPTLGLDIQTRREIWRYINELRVKVKMTIFLTTHYMDEADALCDRIAIIDYGKIKALDTPSKLKSSLGDELVEFTFHRGSPPEIAAAVADIGARDFVNGVRNLGNNRFVASVTNGEAAVPLIFEALAGRPVFIGAISHKRPSLDDVFLHYTGREMRENGGREDVIRSRIAVRRARA
ncbi:MAG: ATP-binding cassette domain-containing protein [Syntrophomonadaceae bacterium]|nr:ATP-binding cassette domain-containing protein [Syntrophomonadaceae bacterium]